LLRLVAPLPAAAVLQVEHLCAQIALHSTGIQGVFHLAQCGLLAPFQGFINFGILFAPSVERVPANAQPLGNLILGKPICRQFFDLQCVDFNRLPASHR
jgi:hypothetical protein